MRLDPSNPRVTAHACERCGKVRYYWQSALRFHRVRFCKECTADGKRRPPEERFWSRVDVGGPDDCWPNHWAKARGGYGSFALIARKQMVLAHRYSWYLAHGAWPPADKPHVLHKCDNPTCVNPAHLWIGTNEDNMQDKVRKGRQAKGERAGGARLTTAVVRAIRGDYANGVTQQALRQKYGLKQTHVSRIVNRRSWKHV